VRQEQVQGILITALEVLAVHFGYCRQEKGWVATSRARWRSKRALGIPLSIKTLA
jgi:hypothetical protein